MKHTMKNVLAAGLSLAMMASLAACGGSSASSAVPAADSAAASTTDSTAESTSSSGSKTIVGIYKMGTATWFIQEGAASQKVVEDAGYTWKFLDADLNAATYMEQLNTVIADKVDGVLVCVPDQNLSQTTVDMLSEAGIPVIAVDDAL